MKLFTLKLKQKKYLLLETKCTFLRPKKCLIGVLLNLLNWIKQKNFNKTKDIYLRPKNVLIEFFQIFWILQFE